MKSLFRALACCGLGLSLNTPIGVAAEWEPVNTDAESKSTTRNQVDNGRFTQWSPVQSKSETSSKTNRQVVWTPVEPSKELAPSQPTWAGMDTETKVQDQIRWKPVEPAIAQDIEADIDNEQPIKDASVKNVAIKPPVMPSGATFANDKALWRDDTWHPQISDTVPIGFGPKGWMASFGLYGYDCNNVGGTCEYPSSWDDYLEQLERQGEAHYDYALSFGDSEKFVGLTVHGKFEETSLPLGDRNASSDNSLFDTYYIGVDLSRHIGPDTSVRIGIRNWLDIVENDTDFIAPKSAYGVISQRIRLRNNQDTWFSNAYLTAGVGNGEFRSVDQKFLASVAAQRSAGCTTYGYNKTNCPINTRLLANNRSVHYGELVPIGALALEVYPGLNLIGEWRSGNLNAGLSIRPFEEIGLVFTGMFSSLIKNCDWGCTVSVPDVPERVRLEDDLITNRPKLSVSASLNFKF